MDQFKTECRECAQRLRDYVECSKVRADQLGVTWQELQAEARAHGLIITAHGRFGYIARVAK